MGPFAVLVIPVLAILDYQLTLAGAALVERRYRQHFRVPSYELNPLMQSVIRARKRVSWRHLALVAFITGLVYVEGLLMGFESSLFTFLLAFVFGAYASVTGRHLANLLTFRFLEKHPEDLSGTVEMSQAYITRLSQYMYLSTICPLIVAAFFSPTPAVFGVAAGVLALYLGHGLWYRRARKQEALQRASGLTEPAEQRSPPAA
jgi:hypothetical protein